MAIAQTLMLNKKEEIVTILNLAGASSNLL